MHRHANVHAIKADCKLRLRYFDKVGFGSGRIIWPVWLGFFETVEILVAWCETREAFRHFRLDRIATAEKTGQRYPERHRILLAEWRIL